jgi:hypothetical protein
MGSRRLLIISCSRTKDKTSELLPAWQRYKGRVFSTLKEIDRRGQLAEDIDIVIISGKYGFLRPDDLIELYDQRMTPELANNHRRQVVDRLSNMLACHKYHDCFILLEPQYFAVLGGIDIPYAQIEHEIDQQSLERLRQWVIRKNR